MLRLAAAHDGEARPLYARPDLFSRSPVLAYTALIAAAALYGFTFVYFGSELPVPFVIPLVLLLVAALWVMPNIANPPYKLFRVLFIGLFFSLTCWPVYIAILLPGMPWITAIRIFAFPLQYALIYTLFTSPEFRERSAQLLGGDKYISWGVFIFAAMCGLSIFLSGYVLFSFSKFLLVILLLIFPFLAGIHFFSREGAARTFAIMLVIAVTFSVLVGLYEAQFQQLPWKDRVPSFLLVPNENIQQLLAGIVRAASGVYRVQSRFDTSIGLGEFFGLSVPFILHLIWTSRSFWLRAFLVLLLPCIYYVVIKTDSRLAFIAFVSSILLYTLYVGTKLWLSRRDGLIGPSIVLAYPVGMAGFMVLANYWGPLRVKVWGSGAASFSTMARQEQMDRAIPMIMSNPFGHGIGRGAEVLGFYIPEVNLLTIDSYFLSVALELGVLGFLLFYGMFAWAIGKSALTSVQSDDPEVAFLAPASIALVNFVISKSIYSQTENHSVAFMILAMIVALLGRYRNLLTAAGSASSPPIGNARLERLPT